MDYKKMLMDELLVLRRHTTFQFAELSIMPTFQRHYYLNMVLEKQDGSEGWDPKNKQDLSGLQY